VRDEQEFVRQAKKLDVEAIGQLYESYFDKIYRYIVLKIGNRMEAEDLTQQVFLNAIRSIDSFRWRGIPFSSWLFRIAHNQVVDCLRKKDKRQTTTLEGAANLIVSSEDPMENVELQFSINELYSAMKRLTEAQQEVISLRFSGDLPIAEVAKLMGRSEGAVKALQHSAIISLRKTMGIKE